MNFSKTLFFWGLTFQLGALYFGNPAAPELPEDGILLSKESWLGIKTGYRGDLSHQSLLRKNNKAPETTHVETYETFANQGILTFNVNDRFEIYGSLGTLYQTIILRAENSSLLKGATENKFLWGGGARLILFHWNAIVCGIDANYARSHAPLESLTQNGKLISSSGSSLKNSSWQIGIGLAHEIDIIVPYIGLKYQFTKVNCQGSPFQSLNKEFNNKNTVGLALGASFSREQLFVVNLETTVINERALSLSLDFRF